MSDFVKMTMAQLPILPGEYLPGYITRLRHAFFYVDEREFLKLTDGVQLGKLDKLLPKSILRLVYLNLKKGQRGKILHNHVSSRYWRGFLEESVLDKHVTKELASKKSRRGLFKGEELLSDLRKPKFCRSCVISDSDKYGCALWRSTHQIPSVFVCPEHEEPLIWCEIDPLSTLINYPSPQLIPNEIQNPFLISVENEDLSLKSLYLLGQKTERNRKDILELKNEVKKELGARTVSSGVAFRLDVVKEWNTYLDSRLNDFESSHTKQSSLVSLKRFHPNEIATEKSLTHPLMFLLLLQFTEKFSGTRILS